MFFKFADFFTTGGDDISVPYYPFSRNYPVKTFAATFYAKTFNPPPTAEFKISRLRLKPSPVILLGMVNSFFASSYIKLSLKIILAIIP